MRPPAAMRPSIRASMQLRGQPGQIEVAAAILAELMADSEIRRSHIEGDDRVQDPYSLRCQPQVMGAVLDQLRYAAGVIEREINAVSDNPLVFADTDEVVSGGNFHAEPVAHGRRRHGDCHRRDRRDLRAPDRAADRSSV